MLKIVDLCKTYGDKKAVDHLSLEIMSGEICAFIGHNGAGKTTTLKAVAGILAYDQGDIYVDGLALKDNPLECKRRLAYIPDNPDLYDYMTGLEFLNFVADIFGMSSQLRQEKIAKYSTMFDLNDVLGQLISAYSHGMKQKLALVSALIHEPKLLLMDEPFVGLDPIASFKLKELMAQICKEGCAIFFSTHVLDVAEKICDKVAIIKEGRLIVTGPMAQVKGDLSLESVFLELE